jgi:hypothetical protein
MLDYIFYNRAWDKLLNELMDQYEVELGYKSVTFIGLNPGFEVWVANYAHGFGNPCRPDFIEVYPSRKTKRRLKALVDAIKPKPITVEQKLKKWLDV